MFIALNHKSNFTKEEIQTYLEKYKELNTYNHDLVLIPTICYLPFIEGLTFGSQDVSENNFGAYTGETSAEAIKSLGATYTLINHSERLTKLGENLEISKKKLQNAINSGLIPIICIGDTKEEHDNNIYLDKIKKDLDYLLEGIKNKEYIIAYEPIFAIGTGIIPSIEDIEKVVNMLKDEYKVKILYGGSVNLENIRELKEINNLDGFLLGGISLDINQFQQLLDTLS